MSLYVESSAVLARLLDAAGTSVRRTWSAAEIVITSDLLAQQ